MVIKFLFASILLLSGCSDNSMSMVHNKKILDEKIECLRLVVFPPKQDINDALESVYEFKDDCDLALIVSYKGGIVCNSNQNSEKKALGMPNSYIRLEIKRANQLFYSYYKDIYDEITQQDIKDGFDKIKKDLTFTKSQ